MNKTLLKWARCMRLNASLNNVFWAQVVNMSSMSCCKALEEVWKGKPLDYSDLWIFSCACYMLIQDSQRSKLDSKSKECIIFGFKKEVKGYKLWYLTSYMVIIKRDIVFNKERILKPNWLKEKKVQERDNGRIMVYAGRYLQRIKLRWSLLDDLMMR